MFCVRANLERRNSFGTKNWNRFKKNYQPFELTINRGSTIVLQFDQDIWDLDEAQQLAKVWQDAYPHNQIMVTFKGVEIKGVLNEKFL